MANANQVIVNGKTILDLRSDTVTPETLQKGYTAHDKSGTKITGTLEVPAIEERTVELSMPSGNQVIQPTSGKVMRKVTVQKPATLLPGNIKKGVVIGGVTGTLEASSSGGGGSGETTSLKVYVADFNLDTRLYCLWQTSNGWVGTANFDTTTPFTIPNVIIGGYVIFTQGHASDAYFNVQAYEGIERFYVNAMDSQNDVDDASLVIKVTASSPQFELILRS